MERLKIELETMVCPVQKWCGRSCDGETDYHECQNYRHILRRVMPEFAHYEERITKGRRL